MSGDDTMKLREGLIFGLGNPLLDISANVTDDFLVKYDLPPNAQILAEDKHDHLCEDMVSKYSVIYTPGGSVQNTMRVCQWFFQHKQSNVCTYTGAIGDDQFGAIMASKAAEDGVKTVYMTNVNVGTGKCAVCISHHGKKRSLCAFLLAANTFKKDHLLKQQALIDGSRVFYSSGFHLTVSPESTLYLGDHAASHPHKLFSFNLSAPFIMEFYSEQLLSVIPYVDLLFCNETEAESFNKMMKWGCKTLEEIGPLIVAMDKKNKEKHRMVIITQGADETLVFHKGVCDKFPVQKLEQEALLDTNGAGDAFAGGYLSQLVLGKPLEVRVKAANFAAWTIIQQSGCTFPKENGFKE